MIDGHNVELFLDHKLIVSADYSKNTPKSDRQQQYIAYIFEYKKSVPYIKGNNNIVTDFLSRPVNAV